MPIHRRLIFSAVALTVTAFTLGAAPAALAKGSGGDKPPGNNGTVKIDEYTMDPGNDNDPHVTCDFSVTFFGYDGGAQQASISVTPVSPTRGNGSYSTSTTWNIGTRTSGNQFDQNVPVSSTDISRAIAGVTPQAQQGYHLRLEVEVTGSQGSDDKYKTFWLEPCASSSSPTPTASPTPTPTPTPSPSPTPSPTPTPTPTPAGGATTSPGSSVRAPVTVTPVESSATGTPTVASSAAAASTADSTTTTTTTDAAATTGTAGGASLAFTGADIAGLSLAGLLLIAAGALIAAWARKSRIQPN
jgi:hypothetical protein